jgi:acyl-CoA reductase-like NAD-dependent aldehyde dehydrogenase
VRRAAAGGDGRARLPVRKTYKLYVGGEFTRSESGRTLALARVDGTHHIARASRKDVRDAVRAARAAWAGWRGRSAYNRGQVVYRLAEMMESRRDQFIGLLKSSGQSANEATREFEASVDRVIWYAGWCDKIEQTLSTKNPVAGPHFNVSSPEPTGVVGVLAPTSPSLLGLVSTLVPPLCGGNAVVGLAGTSGALNAVAIAEAVATSDMPKGTLNILTGDPNELLPHLAAHFDVNALDLWSDDAPLLQRAHDAACESVKRVRRSGTRDARFWFSERSQSPRWIEAFVEIKTVWHPAGV